MRPYLSAMFIACVVSVPLFALDPKVSKESTINIGGGESQSTIVPPNVKPQQCPAGRILMTNDHLHPPTAGFLKGRDLDKPDGPDVETKFNMPNMNGYKLDGTADHDLITLSNGNVLYVTAAWKNSPISAPWASQTSRGDFGPNARTTMLVWRSKDCGATFDFLGELDPIKYETGLCAQPQLLYDQKGLPKTTGPWNMGGTDGQLVTYNAKTGHLYMTHPCVGFNAVPGKTPYALNPGDPVAKMLIAVSYNEGEDWHSVGFTNSGVTQWRSGVIPSDDDGQVVLGYRDGFIFGKNVQGTGKYVYGQPVYPAGGQYTTPTFPQNDPYIFAFMRAHTLIGRTPGTKGGYFVVYPSADGSKGKGVRIAFYDPASGKVGTPAAILPAVPDATNFLLHPVLIDNGTVTPFLYWTDVNYTAKKATVRGCLVLGPQKLGNVVQLSKEFELPKTHYWFGDYETAGAFHTATSGSWSDVYYPMWPEPDNTLHFARVSIGVVYAAASKQPSLQIDPKAIKNSPPPTIHH